MFLVCNTNSCCSITLINTDNDSDTSEASASEAPELASGTIKRIDDQFTHSE